MRNTLLLMLVACGGDDVTGDEAAGGQNSYPVVATSPEQPPQPAPLMRQAVMCCGDLAFERVVGAFVELTESLVSGDLVVVTEKHGSVIEALLAKEHRGEVQEKVLQDLSAIDLSTVETVRDGFGPVSDELIVLIQDSSSASGQYDLAVGYSREADHHWIQSGVEPRSPYGDGINSYSWGTREDVQTADAAREIEMGNNQLGEHTQAGEQN